MSFLFDYGLFFMKTITILIAIVIVITMITHAAQRKTKPGQLSIIQLSANYRQMKSHFTEELLKSIDNKSFLKKIKKAENNKEKQRQRDQKNKSIDEIKQNQYVIDFRGSVGASEVASLREEITAIIAVAKLGDQVLIKVESGGGVVHGYGLAAAQLQRLRNRDLKLTIAIDKVAASGGYMMACVANKIIAAPFAIVGSIGVVAQLPNFNRLLKRNDIDVELHTAGAYKRTLTIFGENNQQGREKFCDELNQTHELFKNFFQQMRPQLDIEHVATGEHWYGQQALEKKLIDEISTSDEFIIDNIDRFNVIGVRFIPTKKIIDRITHSGANAIENIIVKWWHRGKNLL